MARWGGRKSQAYRAEVFAVYGTSCWLRLEGCTHLATTVDHVIPRERAPWLAYVVANGRPACQPCNSKRGARDAPKTRKVTDETRFFF